jgi:hypothetical protein
MVRWLDPEEEMVMETGRWWRVGAGLLLALIATRTDAQDTNYWALQYGPVAQLLGGQVIGGDRDLSATYYNPGGLALGKREVFLLSTQSIQYENYSTQANRGDVFDTSSDRFGTAPTLVAGVLPRGWLGEDTRMAWSFLTRQQLESELGERRLDPLGLEPEGNSTSTFYVANYVTENWAGVSAARPLSDSLGLGLTLYGVYRGQQDRTATQFLGVSGPDSLTALANQDFNYSHFRLLAKAGVAWERNGIRFGLNVTTPSVGLFGWGNAGYAISLSGVDANADGVPDTPLLIDQSAQDLDATYKSSWAIGGGVAWYRGDTRWHASAEWFAPVSRFTVLDVPPTGEVQLTLTQQLKSVVNAGVGVEHDFGNDVEFYGAAFTDFSASTGDPDINVAVSNWNLYHMSAGAKFAFAGSRFTLGATFSFGSKVRPLVVNAPPGSLPEELEGISLDVKYRRVVLLLGFLFGGSK